MFFSFFKKKGTEKRIEKIDILFHKKLDKWMKTAPKSVTGYDLVLDENNAYIKVYFNEDLFHTEISFISSSLSDCLEKMLFKFKGINVYNDNNEVCFTFSKCRG